MLSNKSNYDQNIMLVHCDGVIILLVFLKVVMNYIESQGRLSPAIVGGQHKKNNVKDPCFWCIQK